MKQGFKKQTVIILAFVCALALVLGAVMIIGISRTGKDNVETVKPSVTIPVVPPEREEGETSPPPLHDGKVFRVLCGAESSLDFGDNGVMDSKVSRMAYERNRSISSSLGVVIAFDYTRSVYEAYTNLLKSGFIRYDLLSVNMASDGNRLLMNGGLDNVYSSSLDLSSPVFDAAFMETFAYEGNCGFLMGEANPSRLLCANALFVSKSMTGADTLYSLAYSGELTYDALFETLLESEASLRVDENSFHAAISANGIFDFLPSGEGKVNIAGYANRYSQLLPHIKSGAISVSEQSHSEVFIDTLSDHESFEYYYVLPMPKYSVSDGYVTTVDMSSLLAYAVPSALADRDKTYDVIEHIYNGSAGFSKALAEELSLSSAGLWMDNIKYCLYDVFGWGDFSTHAWKAFSLGESADAFSLRITAPTRAAEQALLILAERRRTH